MAYYPYSEEIITTRHFMSYPTWLEARTQSESALENDLNRRFSFCLEQVTLAKDE
jgi:hypothetical protein